MRRNWKWVNLKSSWWYECYTRTNLHQMIAGFPSSGSGSLPTSFSGPSTGIYAASTSLPCRLWVCWQLFRPPILSAIVALVQMLYPQLTVHTATFASTVAWNVQAATRTSLTRVKPLIGVSSKCKLKFTVMKRTINLLVFSLNLNTSTAKVAENVAEVLWERHI